MKIIGISGEGKLLVEATRDEIAQLAGFASNSYYEDRGARKPFKPGDQVLVDELYRHKVLMQGISAELMRARAIMDVVACGIVMADNVVSLAAAPSKDPE